MVKKIIQTLAISLKTVIAVYMQMKSKTFWDQKIIGKCFTDYNDSTQLGVRLQSCSIPPSHNNAILYGLDLDPSTN